MPKQIEEHLADYLLGMSRGHWSKEFNRRNLEFWRQHYGEKIAAKVESIVRGKWKA